MTKKTDLMEIGLVWKTLMKAKENKEKVPIFVYGAGGQGQRIYSFLKKNQIDIEGFCQTESEEKEKVFGKKCLSYEKVKKIYKKFVLLVSVRPQTGREIVENLKNQNEKNLIFPMCMPYKLDN